MIFSVIINNHNYGAYLGEAIESVLEQTCPAAEVIVVDDGSTDDSRDVMARFGDKIMPVFQAHMGQVTALNAGWQNSHGDILCLLDADDVFLPDKLASIQELFRSGLPMELPILCSHFLRIVNKDKSETGKTLPDQFKNIHLESLTQGGGPQLISTPEQAAEFVRKYSVPPFLGAPTSGLFFNRSFAGKMFPLPSIPGIRCGADGLIVRGGLLCAEAYCYPVALGLYRDHGRNIWFSSTRGNTRKMRMDFTFLNPWYDAFLQQTNPGVKTDYSSSIDAMWLHINREDLPRLAAMPLKFLRRGLYQRNILGALYSLWSLLRIGTSLLLRKNATKTPS